MVNNEECNT